MALTLTNDILKFRESTSDPWEKLLIQANINFNLIYPVGSIYMSTVNVDPSTIFGGTWERLKDKFLLGAGDTYTAGDTGGEAEHTLTESEIPSHTHGSKSLVGTMNPLSWASSASESGIVSAVQQHVDRVGNSGSNWGDRLYTIDATHEHTSVGGDQAHNNMPPYLVVYMWRRLTLSPTVYTPPANVLIGEVASEDIVPVSKGGTGADNAADARTNLGLNWTTVWTNNSTDSDFASQTIPLDLSGYKEFVVRFTSMKTSTPDTSDNFEFYVSTKDVVFFCSGFANTFIRRRTMKVSDTGVLFGTGTYLSSYGSGGVWNDNNANFVPITIKAR